MIQTDLRFDGDEYVHDRDAPRLTGQLARIVRCMRDGQPRTLKQIAEETGDPEASISAQLRHLRKERFGSHKIHKSHLGHGLYTYRVEFNGKVPVIE